MVKLAKTFLVIMDLKRMHWINGHFLQPPAVMNLIRLQKLLMTLLILQKLAVKTLTPAAALAAVIAVPQGLWALWALKAVRAPAAVIIFHSQQQEGSCQIEGDVAAD